MDTANKLEVLFDWDAVVRNPHSGFFTFGTSLIEAICRLNCPLEFRLLFQRRYEDRTNEFLQGLTQGQRAKIKIIRTILKFRLIERLWELSPWPSLELTCGSYHIYHCFHHFMPRRSKGVRLLTVHDLRRYNLPGLYKRSNLRPFELAVKRADHFLCVSNATKRDLCSVFSIKSSRVDVVHLAAKGITSTTKPFSKINILKLLKKNGIGCKQYFLAFSSKDRRKNIYRIAQAFHLAKKALPAGTALVIIGEINKNEKREIEGIPAVYPIGEVSNVYPWLFGCVGLIFASLYEGFGLPILEAFSAGTPVITSNCSSMPEVAGEAALLVDPYNVKDISQAISTVGYDKEMRTELIKKGDARLKKFSWEKSAAKVLKVYRQITA